MNPVHPQSPRDVLAVESGFKIQALRVRSGKTPADRRGMKYSRGYGLTAGGAHGACACVTAAVVVATSLAFGSRDIMEEEEEDRKRPEAVSRQSPPSVARPRK